MQIKTITGALLGAVLIHLVFVACGGGEEIRLDGSTSADAQAAGGCTVWETQVIAAERVAATRGYHRRLNGTSFRDHLVNTFEPIELEPGWEPISGNADEGILLRRCVR